MSAYTTLFARIPTGTPAGKSKIIRTVLANGLELQEARATVAKRDELAPKGRAALLEKHIKHVVGPVLTKARRQLAYHNGLIERQRAAMRAKAIGVHDPLDAERRAVLRAMAAGERIQAALSDPAFRQAALRGGAGLSGLTEDILSKALEAATKENAPGEVARLAIAEEAQEVYQAAVTIFTREILETPVVIEPNGAVRKFTSLQDLEKFLTKEVPLPHATLVVLEEKEADATDEAA